MTGRSVKLIVAFYYVLFFMFGHTPFPPLDNIRVMVIVWRLSGNVIRTAPYGVV